MIYEFGSNTLRCKVSSMGAELISVVHNGKERLWQNDNGGWSGHAPILFPFAGSCAVVVDGVEYPAAKHGFARKKEFSLVGCSREEITFVLRSDEETKAMYPFDFSLFVTYLVSGNLLKVLYKVVNEGDKTMYAGFGSHESYALDGEVDEFEIEFEQDEKFYALYAHEKSGKMTGEGRDFGAGKTLVLDREFMQTDTIIFADVNSHTVWLKRRGGEVQARVSYPDFGNLLLWHPADSRMVCIEPWQNLPDDHGKAPQELSQKKGLTAIPPKGEATAYHEIEYFEIIGK